MGTFAIRQKPRSTHSTAPVSRYAPTVTTSLAPSPYAVGRSRHLDRASTSTVSRADRPLASWPMTPSGITGVGRVAHAPSRAWINEAVLASSGSGGCGVDPAGSGKGVIGKGRPTPLACTSGVGVPVAVGVGNATATAEGAALVFGTGALQAAITMKRTVALRMASIFTATCGTRVRVLRVLRTS